MAVTEATSDLIDDIYNDMSDLADSLCRAVLHGDRNAARRVRENIDGAGRLVLEYVEDWDELLARAEGRDWAEQDEDAAAEEADRKIDERKMGDA